MITFEVEDLQRIDISMIDFALLSDLGRSVEDYSLYLVRGYDDDIPARGALQIIHCDQTCRAGVVLVDGETAGRAVWMGAYSPADALDLYLGNKRTVWFGEGTPPWLPSLHAEKIGEDASISGSSDGRIRMASDDIHEISSPGAVSAEVPSLAGGLWDASVWSTPGA